MFLYNLIISPIEILVEWIFNFITVKFESLGIFGAVCGVSLIINFLALPLYNIADNLQDKERKIQQKLSARVKRIKQTFKGDEQFMILNEYYRQNGYHPLYALRSALSILIEIPFFIAAYNYLSHCEALKGASWWIFSNLGEPDRIFPKEATGLFFDINILPILMTLINFISGAIYTKGFALKEKLQLYGIALVFLVLLYDSPAGLVIYWILNNLFSLAKNIVLKMKNPRKIIWLIFCVIFALLDFLLITKDDFNFKKMGFILFSFLVYSLPVIKRILNNKRHKCVTSPHNSHGKYTDKPSIICVLLSGLGIALLSGFLLPASVIATSPIEFSFLGECDNPVSYIVSSFFTFAGFFVFWPVLIYKMFGNKVKKVIQISFFAILIQTLLNAFIFHYAYGNLNISFELEKASVLRNNSFFYSILPLLTFAVLIAIPLICIKFKKSYIITYISAAICVSVAVFGFTKLSSINSAYSQFAEIHHSEIRNDQEDIKPVFHLSENNKNVVVIFLDRGINSYFPHALEQFPELKSAYKDFTYYPETLSFSINTFLAFPAMAGGYEYTLENINKDPRLIREKFAEASLVMPKLFKNNGYEISLCDLAKPDSFYKNLEIYNNFDESEYADIYGKITDYYFKKNNIKSGVSNDKADKICRKEIVNFSMMQILYPPVRITFYNNFTNHASKSNFTDFYNNKAVLDLLPEMTDFNSDKPNFIFIDNELTHSPIDLDDNFEFPGSKENIENLVFYPSTKYDQMHYNSNVLAIKLTAKWITKIQENQKLYDNTRIIIVSDHGRDLDSSTFFEKSSITKDQNFFHPVLLFKDFNESSTDKNYKTDYSFMTNADTLFLATKDLNFNMKNPFTEKNLIQEKQNGIKIWKSFGEEYNGDSMKERSNFTLLPENGYIVKPSIQSTKNWTSLKE